MLLAFSTAHNMGLFFNLMMVFTGLMVFFAGREYKDRFFTEVGFGMGMVLVFSHRPLLSHSRRLKS